jgi:DNA-binding XRE family transcriptional regulator
MAIQYTANTTAYEQLDLVPGNPNIVTITDLIKADDAVATIELGANNFKFYDTVYTSLTIDSNGRIVLGTEQSEYINTDLTSNESTPGIIAPFWDDLNTASDVAASGSAEDNLILYQIEGDRLIIEWNNVHFFGGGDTTDGITFQTILQLNTGTANGNIIFNYPDLTEQELEDNNGTFATVGVKAPGSQTTSSFDRTLVSFNQTNSLVGASKAILFTPTTINPNIPNITSGTAVTIAENSTQAVYTVTATAPQGATLTYNISGADANLFNIDSNTGVVSFKAAPDFETPPDNGADNVYNINVIANNGDLSNSQEVAITVTDVNETPVLKNPLLDQTTNENQTFNFQLPTNTFTDIDADDVLTYSATLENGNALPSWLTFNSTTRTFSGTPTNDNVGNLNIKAIATDKAGATVSDIFVITVENVNDAPTLANTIADQTAKQGDAFSFQIPTNTFTDVDAGDVLTYSATLENGDALPSWLTFNPTTRTFSGTPSNDNVGSLNVKVTATDKAGTSANDIFAIAVENVNDAPILSNAIANQNAKQGDAFNFQIPPNTFTDIDAGDVLTYSATLENGNALPSWLTFNSTTRTFSGTPTNDNVGSLNVKVAATDKAGASVNDIFVIAVEKIIDNQSTTVGTPGDDKLIAIPGSQFDGQNNIVFTGAGKDEVDLSTVSAFPNSGNNIVDLGSGDDTIFVNKGDRAFGSDGNDIFDARDSQGNNRISGGVGDDIFYLGSNDRALGGDGNDIFKVSLGGGNLISGGAGADQFWIVNAELPKATNTVLDFQLGTDVIGIQGTVSLGITTSTLKLNQVGGDTAIVFNNQTLATLTGIQANSLNLTNTNQFIFA